MPLVRTCKNDIEIIYNLPKRKKNLLTKEVLETLKKELDTIFYPEKYYEPIEKRTYWNTYQMMEETSGFHTALKNTCERHNLKKAIYEYARSIPWYDRDIFDGEITLLMLERGVIEEGNVNELYDGTEDKYYENDPDYELKITRKEHKGFTLVTKDWVLKEKC